MSETVGKGSKISRESHRWKDEKRDKDGRQSLPGNCKMKNEAKLTLKIGGMYGEAFCVEVSKNIIVWTKFGWVKREIMILKDKKS